MPLAAALAILFASTGTLLSLCMPAAHLLPVCYDIGECRSSHLYSACDKFCDLWNGIFFLSVYLKK